MLFMNAALEKANLAPLYKITAGETEITSAKQLGTFKMGDITRVEVGSYSHLEELHIKKYQLKKIM